MIKIEKGIPIPEGKATRGKKSKYPFSEMEINDSFEIESKEFGDTTKILNSLRVCYTNYCRKILKQILL